MLSTIVNSVNPPHFHPPVSCAGNIAIKSALTAYDYSQARRLLRAYAEATAVDLEIDGFSAELRRLASIYRPPRGAFLLAGNPLRPIGCVGWRMSEPDIAEVKRLFVVPEYTGCGVGRALLEKLIEQVRNRGIGLLRLEVLRSSPAAIALYRKLGFGEIAHYRRIAALAPSQYCSMQLDLGR